MSGSSDDVLPDWLDPTAVVLDEFDREYRPYAAEDPAWTAFFDHIHPRDEIREFITAAGSFAKCGLKAGYAIVRGGKIVAAITTMRNDRTQLDPTVWKADDIA